MPILTCRFHFKIGALSESTIESVEILCPDIPDAGLFETLHLATTINNTQDQHIIHHRIIQHYTCMYTRIMYVLVNTEGKRQELETSQMKINRITENVNHRKWV